MYCYYFSKTHFWELLKEAKDIQLKKDSFQDHECLNFIKRKLITFLIEGTPKMNHIEYEKKYSDAKFICQSNTYEDVTYGEPYYTYNGDLSRENSF